MPVHHAYRPLPQETDYAARAIFKRENVYLIIGDQIDSLFGELNMDHLSAFDDQPTTVLFVLAMVTLFQIAENLSDRQAADAIRMRLDWKYALHLPINYPGWDHAALSEFRQQLQHNTFGQDVLQGMMICLKKLDLFGHRESRWEHVIDAVNELNTLNKLIDVREMVSQTIESLAAIQPEWLRLISLPHWFERYSFSCPIWHLPASSEEQEIIIKAIEKDIGYLLEAAGKNDAPNLVFLPEMQNLRHVWQQRHQHESINKDLSL